MHKRTVPPALASAMLASATLLALAGCGSSAPTKSQYIAKADAICVRERTQTTPLIGQVTASAAGLAAGNAASTQKLATSVQQLHDVSLTYLGQLKKLEKPSGEHAAIESFLTPFASLVGALGEAAAALEGGKAQQALTLLEKVQPTSQQATSAARAYGLTQCETVLSALG